MPVVRRIEYSRPTRFGAWLWLCLAATANATDPGGPIECHAGNAVAADLGDGVVMHTCLLKNSATEFVRVGPLLLVRNGIPILRAQTNRDGQLHGLYQSWSDAGVVTARGHYHEGVKHGAWLVFDERGRQTKLHYLNGRLIRR